MTPDDELARWVASLTLASMSPAVRERTRLLLVDAVASAFAGCRTPDVPAVAGLGRSLFGPGTSPLIGGGRLAPAGAAFANGFRVTAATVCDVHRPTLTHVTPEVVPAALAAAHESDATGADLLAAVAAGAEVAVRVAQALDTDGYRARRFHNPGIAGAVGAACAAARAMRLDERSTRDAIAHATSQAAGTFVALGTAGVKVHQARGALSGLLAAGLAGAGIDGADRPLSSPDGGLLAAYADGGRPGLLTDGLGTEWTIDEISLRRWPAASSLQPVIAATVAARGELPARADVASAIVALPPRGFALNGHAGWASQLEALQSARWIVAVVVADGECWIEQTAPARLGDTAVGAFASGSVQVVEDSLLPEGAARVRLVTADGMRHEHEVRESPGDPRSPLGWDDAVAKLERALDTPDAQPRARLLTAGIANLDETPTRVLGDLLADDAPAARKDAEQP